MMLMPAQALTYSLVSQQSFNQLCSGLFGADAGARTEYTFREVCVMAPCALR